MNEWFVYLIGFLAQLLFGSRMVIQWIHSEKAGYVVSPTLFWKTSLIASALFLVYGFLRTDIIIIAGQVVAYFIYIRNLQLKGEWIQFSTFARIFFFLLPVIICLSYLLQGSQKQSMLPVFSSDYLSILIGGTGQLLLNVRFIYQWYVSEKSGVSYLPLGFWVISAVGSVLVIGYSVMKLDPVLFVAQALGVIVYTRNIVLFIRSPENSKYHESRI